ncbi:MAG: putative lipid II flippase FtsW, partial [Microthrixaceae bacterium]|nr:putative lipid II flippase FtsW [Microthrixaceae bacterium]
RPAEQTVLFWALSLLLGLGAVMVYSASSVTAQRTSGNTWSVVARHSVYMAIGLALLFGASRIPIWVWRQRLTPILLVLSFAGLVLVAIPGMPLASEVNGANRWLRVGPLGFQPSELAKLALVLWLAQFLVTNRDRIEEWSVLKRAAMVAAPLCGLVLVGDDLGTTLLLGVIFAVLWFLSGAPLRQLAAVGGAMLGVGLIAVTYLEGFRVQRVLAYLSPQDHADGAGYQTLQSQIGFASGGLWGRGPGASKAKWGFLPEAHTDFILAVIGEELGLIGTIVIIGSLTAVVGAGIAIGLRTEDRFARLVAFGISTWLGVQALVNVGVAVGALPTKGIPLPFVSSGGTSMIVSLMAIGVLWSISRSGSSSSRMRAPRPARAR